MVFDVTNVGIHDCDHQIVLFLNELQINSIASKLMDQCSFITPIPSGYHFSVTPEGIVTFIIRMQYVDLSKTSDVTHEDFPQIKRITDCLSKNGKIHHGDLANRNVKKMNDGRILIYDWGEASYVSEQGGLNNADLQTFKM